MTMTQLGVPAWKRLGLKLKYANENPERLVSNGQPTTTSQAVRSEPGSGAPEPPKKRRKIKNEADGISVTPEIKAYSSPGTKESLTESSTKGFKKQVSFSVDTKPASTQPSGISDQQEPQAHVGESGKKQKQKSTKKAKNTQPGAQKPHAALEYLNQYHSERSNWKFNKNRETWIFKHLTSEQDIPRDYDIALAKYIHGLQGAAAWERLKGQCLELLNKDADQPEASKTEEGDDSIKDRHYAEKFSIEIAETPSSESAPEMQDSTDGDGYQSWVRKQRRPKLLLCALGENKEALSSGDRGTNSRLRPDRVNSTSPAISVKIKKRKNRTSVVELESSSSSSSESDAESESDSDLEEEGLDANGAKLEDDTSSSDESDSTSEGDGEDI